MAKTGLRKITKTVRGKKGSIRRSYWVSAKQPKLGALHMLRTHGVGTVKRGLAAGAIHQTVRYGAGISGFRHGPHVAASRATVGGLAGAVGGTHIAWRNEGGRRIMKDFSKATLGGKATLAALQYAGHYAGYAASRSLFNRAVDAYFEASTLWR